MSVGQDGLPTSGNGSIVINDQWESLGENRRVFDYFDRYTPINQTVTVYRAIETIGDLDMPSSWTLIYTGKVDSYIKDKETLNFSVSNTLVESKIATKTITADMAPTGFEVPESSLGKSLPLVFGGSSKTVPMYSIAQSDTDKSTATYAYCAGFGTQFIEGNYGTPSVYATNLESAYVAVKPYNYYSGSEVRIGSTGAFGYPLSHGLAEFICPLGTLGSLRGSIVTGLSWYCRGQNGGYVGSGNVIMSLYRRYSDSPSFSDVSQPQTWERIASVEVPKSNQSSEFNGASDFWFYGVFEKPVVIQYHPEDYSSGSYYFAHAPEYAIGIYLSNYTSSSTTDATSGMVNAATGNMYYMYNTASAADEAKTIVGSGSMPCVAIDVADWTAGTGSTDLKGMSYQYFSLTQQARNTRKCDLQELDLLTSAPPLADDGSGTITGTIDKLLYEPDEVCKLLGFTWNGSSWVDGSIIDTTTFSSLTTIFTAGSYQRSVQGFTEGDVSAFDIITQIAKEMCCFLVPLSSGKLALWPWGSQLAVTRVFTDSDIIGIGSFEETDPSTVINSIKVEYGKNFLNINDQWEASGKAENIGGVVVIDKNSGPPYDIYLTNSEILYGKRELEESGSQFIGDVTTATTRALYYATRHEHTHRTFDVIVPYFDNSDLKLMDIVDIKSVHGPAYFGSTSKARLPVIDGQDHDPFLGEYPRRSQRRRCQIIGLNNDYNGDFPKLVMTVREIKTRHKNDPTAENF